MITKAKTGFTLIEILIVVAIIAILASVVLVGLGPTQSLGRDARRVSDLHEIQNGLELYNNKNGTYPIISNGAAWATFQQTLTGAGIGVNSVPSDPTTSKTYTYATNAGGSSYVVGAILENNTGGPWAGYNAPANAGSMTNVTQGGSTNCTQANYDFCLSL